MRIIKSKKIPCSEDMRAKLNLAFMPDYSITHRITADTGACQTVADHDWILESVPDIRVQTKEEDSWFKGVGGDVFTDKYAVIPMYFDGTHGVDGERAIAWLANQEVILVKNLGTNMLLGMDILGTEKMDVIVSQGRVHIGSCGVDVDFAEVYGDCDGQDQ